MIAGKVNESPMADSTGGSDVLGDEAQRDGAPPGLDMDGTEPENERRMRISTIAYARAASRGFEPGWDLDDWLEAERQVDDELAARASVERTQT